MAALHACRWLSGSLSARQRVYPHNNVVQTAVLHMFAATRQAANSIPVPRQLLQDLEALAAQAPLAAAVASPAPMAAQVGRFLS